MSVVQREFQPIGMLADRRCPALALWPPCKRGHKGQVKGVLVNGPYLSAKEQLIAG